MSAAQARARLAADAGAWVLQGFGVWAVERRTDQAVVGVCGFWQGAGWPRELTWWLLPEARGGGLALEASRAAVAHAYRVFGWPVVHTYMNDGNAPARALALRLGGQCTGRQPFPDGLERDVFCIPDAKAPPPRAGDDGDLLLQVRPATPEDLDALAGFDEFNGSRAAEVAHGGCLVAVDGGRVVGYASVEPRGLLGQPVLSYLCVHPDFRGQGRATALVRAVQRVARGRVLVSSTEDWCTQTQRIFERLGWRRIGQLSGINKDGSAEVFFATDLGKPS